ncbi:carboxylesterase/lipase family protein [Novosphingobium sp. SG720]|uniref:carboxylesterase/lipase family protein n=1 Tax=Novosphingobium sp. SG720 TaxID=2586998 RepID=UPI001445CC55|nr:carboxylesterase/lipase family protein [Novosphingobium sp. SG720]NKJ42354.1 para-nitrobenzyl esterase [Novosphingobium sp. SG720]
MALNPTQPVDLLIETRSGTVRGVVDGGVRTWRGIPYAAPPVGDWRFRGPRPPQPWQGIRDPYEFGALPVQKRGFEPIGGAGRKTPMDEDCLTINVSAPLDAGNGPRPVVVWIYGGGFSLGGSRTPLYRGQHLVAEGDIVFVSFNYRVGVFGFSDFSAWSTDENPIDSNPGLRDQVAALTWVQENIHAFGGDPGNVTIVGQSAGAMSAVTLMGIPAARGLFHRVFAMSAAGISVHSPQRHNQFARELLAMLGVDPEAKDVAARALKRLPAQDLNAVAARFFYDIAPDRYPGFLPSSPVIDGDFLPQHPIDAFREGKAHPAPLVIGTMSREGAMLDKALPVLCSRVNRLEAMFASEEPALRTRIAAAYPGYPSRRTAVDIAGDLNFWLPTIQIGEGHAQFSDCWVYRFDYATPLTRLVFGEATHGLDLPMLFGTTGEGELGLLDLFRKRRSREVSRRFRQVFLDFAQGISPGWAQYNEAGRATHVFAFTDRDESDPRQARRIAWNRYRGPE